MERLLDGVDAILYLLVRSWVLISVLDAKPNSVPKLQCAKQPHLLRLLVDTGQTALTRDLFRIDFDAGA